MINKRSDALPGSAMMRKIDASIARGQRAAGMQKAAASEPSSRASTSGPSSSRCLSSRSSSSQSSVPETAFLFAPSAPPRKQKKPCPFHAVRSFQTERWVRSRKLHSKFSEAEMHAMRAWFRMLDTDGNGKISGAEMMDALLSTGAAKNEAEVQRVVRAMDNDADGEVDFREFMHLFETELDGCRQQILGSVQVLHDLLNEVDGNGQLAPDLAISIARRRSLMDITIGSSNNIHEKTEFTRLKAAKKNALRTNDKDALRQCNTDIRSFEVRTKQENRERRRSLSALVLRAATNVPQPPR